MIARIWKGRTATEKADAYVGYLEATGVKSYRATPGNRGVYVLRRTAGDETEFTLVSLWDSMESVRGFAGAEPERPVYYPEDGEFLEAFEPRVTHHEVAVARGLV